MNAIDLFAGAGGFSTGALMAGCHRRTERRVAEIHAGKKRPHDVQIVSV